MRPRNFPRCGRPAAPRSSRLGLAVLALLALVRPAAACEDLAEAPSSRWSVVNDDGVSWLATPCGDPFFSIGVNVIDGGKSGELLSRAHYTWEQFEPSLSAWLAE